MITAQDEDAAVAALLRYADRHPRGEQRVVRPIRSPQSTSTPRTSWG